MAGLQAKLVTKNVVLYRAKGGQTYPATPLDLLARMDGRSGTSITDLRRNTLGSDPVAQFEIVSRYGLPRRLSGRQNCGRAGSV